MYGSPLPQSVIGITAELDGRVLGVAGVAFAKPLQAFSFLSEELKKYPRVIVKAVSRLKELFDSFDLPIYATPDTDEVATADGFLKHVGFEEIEEGVYQWQHSL